MVNLTDPVGDLEMRVEGSPLGDDDMRSAFQKMERHLANLLELFARMRARWEEQERASKSKRKNEERREEQERERKGEREEEDQPAGLLVSREGTPVAGGRIVEGGGWVDGVGRQQYRGRRREIPLFEGDDPDGWVFRAERYFLVNQLSDAEKVESASSCFEGAALSWFQWEQRRRRVRSWTELKAMLRVRFRTAQEGTVEETIPALRQWGSVKYYRLGFEALTSPLTGMPKALLEGHFINGMELVIRAEMKVSRTIGLEQMMDLAQPIEEMNLVIRGSIFGPGPNKGQAPSSPISNHQWVEILPPPMMAQKWVMPSPASSHWPPAFAKAMGEELGVAVLADEKTDTATLCLEGAALPWVQCDQRRRRVRSWEELKGLLRNRLGSMQEGAVENRTSCILKGDWRLSRAWCREAEWLPTMMGLGSSKGKAEGQPTIDPFKRPRTIDPVTAKDSISLRKGAPSTVHVVWEDGLTLRQVSQKFYMGLVDNGGPPMYSHHHEGVGASSKQVMMVEGQYVWLNLHSVVEPNDTKVSLVCIILISLFALQHYGTHKVGFLFAPIIMMWWVCISALGLYNIFHWNRNVYKALCPYYMYKFFKKTRRAGWMSLGGVLLCITGSEAMFADLGHFSQLSIKIAFTSLVYPSLVLAYMGQAAYLSQHHDIRHDYQVGFYVSVPEKLRWPILAVAVLAAVVGSQAIITGTFSIIKQCSALGCFPRIKIVHTSSKIHGQIYIPEINWILMLLCLAVSIGFRDTKRLGNASGLAVMTVMLVTTCLMCLVIVLCWHQSIFLAICFLLLFGTIEALFFSASLIKFLEGAWVPIVLAFILMTLMYSWHYGTLKKYEFDVANKIPVNWLLSLGPSLGIVRVRGIGLIHTELTSGIPVIFSHFVTNLPAFHQVLVFVCVKSLPVPHVKKEERFLVGHIGPRQYRLYRCIARYGYRDVQKDDLEFEDDLVLTIAEFIQTGKAALNDSDGNWLREDENMAVVGTPSTRAGKIQMCRGEIGDDDGAPGLKPPVRQARKRVRFAIPEIQQMDLRACEELRELMEAREAGVAHILGHSYVRSKKRSSLLKKLVINYGYEVLRRNCRTPTYALSLPNASTLEVGMVYHV